MKRAEEIADELDEISNGYVDGVVEAIAASELFDDEEYSEDDIRGFIDYYSNKDNGRYLPHCMAIVDCLVDYLKEKIS